MSREGGACRHCTHQRLIDWIIRLERSVASASSRTSHFRFLFLFLLLIVVIIIIIRMILFKMSINQQSII